VLARIKGRSVHGEVPEIKDGVVYFRPISPGAGWRHATPREIVTHWRKTGRRIPTIPDTGSDDQGQARPGRDQLSLPIQT
jgi:hypothetical protein